MSYDPNNWYWIVGQDDSQVFSSKSGTRVPPTDADYQAWINQEGGPSRIGSWDELFDVLKQQAPDALDRSIDTIITAGTISPERIREVKLGKGISVDSTANKPLKGMYPIDDTSVSRYKVILRLMQSQNIDEVGVLDVDGKIHKFAYDELNKLVTAITDYVDSVNFSEAVALSGISVTWPVNSVDLDNVVVSP